MIAAARLRKGSTNSARGAHRFVTDALINARKAGATRASAHTDTQAEAVGRARDIVTNAGGGEVVIHGRDGQIRDSDTVGGGNDPFPPRDTK